MSPKKCYETSLKIFKQSSVASKLSWKSTGLHAPFNNKPPHFMHWQGKHIPNINISGWLSWDWVGGRNCVCLFFCGSFLMGKKSTFQKSPENPGKTPCKIYLCVSFFGVSCFAPHLQIPSSQKHSRAKQEMNPRELRLSLSVEYGGSFVSYSWSFFAYS